MEINVLGSGSSGNSTFISTPESDILIDAGLSAKRISNSLSFLGKDISEIDAIFVTHEHSDHIRGIGQLSKRYGTEVYMNRDTFNASGLSLCKPNFFLNDHKIRYNDLEISPISISHDAADPCAFSIERKDKTIGIMTDFGKPNSMIKKVISKADALVLETNHDIDLLLNGRYPYHLKQRILGEKGHISNIDAGLLVKDNAGENLKSVFLAHISKNNNTEELALNTFTKLTEDMRIKRIVAKHDEMTEKIRI